MTEHDPVNHPTHYASEAKCSGCGEPIECIDVVRHMGFDLGNAIKYLWRAGKKDAKVQDLKKAVWYIEDMIAELEGRKNPNVHRLSEQPIGYVTSMTNDDKGLSIEYKLANPHIVNRDSDGIVTYDNRACKFGLPSEWRSGEAHLYEYLCRTHARPVRSFVLDVPEKCPAAE